MRLFSIIERLRALSDAGAIEVHGDDVAVSGVTIDSRQADPKTAWVAVRGENAHGAQFAAAALDKGVPAIVTDSEGARILGLADSEASTTLVICDDPRALAAPFADLVYGTPSADLEVVGVTGTNGKTSVTTMVAGALRELERGVGVVGTNGTWVWGADGTETNVPTERTTPEATDLHKLLAQMRVEGAQFAALEVSSHAMVLHRADAVRFSVAAFTNLSQDHLDFHPTMEDYFQAKASLFTPKHTKRAVVCVDDEWGKRLAKQASVPVTTYSISSEPTADYRVVESRSLGFASEFSVEDRAGERFTLISALPGAHYVANTLAVALILRALGFAVADVSRAISVGGEVAGRMELVGLDNTEAGDANCPLVVVDYAHTPDALEKALTTMRALPHAGELVAVIGAGGRRDTTKRPVMGRVAAGIADRLIITDDNPRDEEPSAIREAVAEGAKHSGSDAAITMIGDRAQAIREAIAQAGPNDLVLIAGKGSETGQDLGEKTIEFDDRVHAREALANWREAHGGNAHA